MKNGKNGSQSPSTMEGISKLTVGGFKSIAAEQSVEIRPLTILAGANSSGKSSMVQPILLLKQTLEASYDPGPLLLNGPDVKITSFDQLLSRGNNEWHSTAFSVGINRTPIGNLKMRYGKDARQRVIIQEMAGQDG